MIENETIYSNFDHCLNKEVEKRMMEEPNESYTHCAWDFNAQVTFNGKVWKSEVWVYGSAVETFEGETVMDVINEANERYGDD